MHLAVVVYRYYATNVLLPLLHAEQTVGELCTQFQSMKVEDYQNPRYRFANNEKNEVEPVPEE